jgi:hypothetical protein
MIGRCAGCESKDAEIVHLRELLAKRDEAYLALVNRGAHAAVYPKERKEPEEPPPERVSVSPGQMRNNLWTPPVTDAQVERLFQLQEDLENQEREGTS